MATKHIKIAVSIDALGNWSAFGSSTLTDKNAAHLSNEALDHDSQTYFISAEVELPHVIEVQASSVTKA